MLRSEGVDAQARVTRLRGRWPAVAAASLAAAAAVALLVQMPSAISTLDSRASANAQRVGVGREIAGADPVQIDNDFAVEATRLIPIDATFALVLPATDQIAATYGIAPVTLDALPAFMQNLLLPRRMVPAANAQYLLCYACNTDPYDPHMKRLWTSPKGYVIGRLQH